MVDDVTPPPVFPSYQPPNPNGIAIIDPKQAKPLMKIVNRMLHTRMKGRVSPVKKRVYKKKDRE